MALPVSVIVPVYNGLAQLPRCMDALLAQREPPRELIAVDDGSTDGSAQWLDALAGRTPQLRVIHQENRGVSAARNAGIDAASSEWLCFVDCDDLPEPELIGRLYAAAQRWGVKLACANHQVQRRQAVPTFPAGGEERLVSAEEAALSLMYHGLPDVSVWAKLWHRSLFAHLRYPEGQIYEDTRLIAPLLQAAGQLVWIPDPLYRYMMDQPSITRSGWSADKLQYIDAVDTFTEDALRCWPGDAMRDGCARRQMHALLSVRRYLCGCGDELKPLRAQLDSRIRALAPGVLRNPRTPKRDRLGIRCACCGPAVYDAVWRLYGAVRR